MRTKLTSTLLLCTSLAIAGCTTAPTAPATRFAGQADATPAHIVSDLQLRYTPEAMLVSLAVDPLRPSRFSSERGGAWCFQLFLNTDEQATGYADGLDYLVRAIEVSPAGNMHVRRTQGGSGPGGWGESVGLVNLSQLDGRATFTVPLSMLNDDGCARFVLELYETLQREDGSVWHEFVAGYEGTSVSLDRRNSPIKLRSHSLTSGAARQN